MGYTTLIYIKMSKMTKVKKATKMFTNSQCSKHLKASFLMKDQATTLTFTAITILALRLLALNAINNTPN
jgi:hypothetical protein